VIDVFVMNYMKEW